MAVEGWRCQYEHLRLSSHAVETALELEGHEECCHTLLGRLRQEDGEWESSLGYYIVRAFPEQRVKHTRPSLTSMAHTSTGLAATLFRWCSEPWATL